MCVRLIDVSIPTLPYNTIDWWNNLFFFSSKLMPIFVTDFRGERTRELLDGERERDSGMKRGWVGGMEKGRDGGME